MTSSLQLLHNIVIRQQVGLAAARACLAHTTTCITTPQTPSLLRPFSSSTSLPPNLSLSQLETNMAASDGTRNSLTIVREFQIFVLIACWGILAAFTHFYKSSHIVAPWCNSLSVYFALLASIWAFCVLITQIRARNAALWIAFWDVVFTAALIAGVVLLSNIKTSQCSGQLMSATVVHDNPTGTEFWSLQYINGNSMWNSNNHCDLANLALGVGIAGIILFFISAILSVVIYQQNKQEDEESVREKVYTRRGSAQYAVRSPSHRRHRHRHRDPRTGEYIVEERVV